MIQGTLAVYAEAARQRGLATAAEAFDRGARHFADGTEHAGRQGVPVVPFGRRAAE
jgi:hypothetical protein